ncbi:glucose-6-phosphate dehydrogenase [Intrasporangium oryzae NRRL B-24470]|uniref:Glucose-6-phosphate dehydrogenase n=1 Tax=Intrasporangium oryzae NRRL B-24470 TaxID=1386089 RepID=W9G9A5_9MICO|nr:glucose-6-phosphate dehydrogenase assembly protein OpcA [Intrasporangium oryzae]EWT01832.1 glucose-6-phosphate dehydrogenase [Intrasporangium oryzae NRRL B-24470]
MIRDLTDTTTTGISKTLVRLRNEVGAMALGRVLTLVVVVDDTDASEAIDVANHASRQHPCRIIVVIPGDRRGRNRLDAQIRLGGDAGASEIVVLRLYGALANHGPSVVVPLLLPDSPIVAWWPGEAPDDVAKDPIGAMAQRRITDAAEHRNPRLMLKKRAATYAPGDTDLAWTRITHWRGLLAAALDQPPYESITGAVVSGAPDSPSSDLLAAWLAQRLKVPVRRASTPRGSGITSVRLERPSGPVDLVRPGDVVATLSQFGQPDRRISLPRRELPECLADELRRLDPDESYEAALLHGLDKLGPARLSAAAAAKAGKAPDIEQSRRLAARLGRDDSAQEASAMITAPPAPEHADTGQVHAATVRKLAGKRTPREKETAAARAAAKKAAASKATSRATTKATTGATTKTATSKAAKTTSRATKKAATKKAAASGGGDS